MLNLKKSDEQKNLNLHVRFGLRGKMITFILIPLLIVLLVVGTLIVSQVVDTVSTLKKSEVDSQTDAVAKLIDDFFHPFITSTEVAVDLDSVQAVFAEIQSNDSNFDIRDAKNYKTVLNEMKQVADKQGEGMITLWIVGDKNNQLLHSNGNVTDESFVLATRPWFQQLVENNGETIVTSAYEDVVSGEMVISCATAVFAPGTKEIIGAVGMDISLQSLIEQINGLVIGKGGFVSAFDCDDITLCHPDESLLLTNLNKIPYSENMLSALNLDENTGAFLYSREDDALCGSVAYIPDIGWHIVGTISQDEFREEMTVITLFVIISFAFCIALITVTIIIIASAVVRPLRKLNTATMQLADGDLDVDVNANSSDEVGQMAVSVGKLVERLKTYILYINEVSDVIDKIGQGNLVFELEQDYVGEFNRLKVALNNIKASLSETITQIVDSSMKVDVHTSQIATASQRLAQGSVEQASTVEELHATVQSLSVQSDEDAEKFITLSSNMQNIGSEVANSNDQMQQMVVAMKDITTQSSEIAKIIKAIEDIAFQTNILALNAAVEAARAGAAGKGFTVVADEVRNLATKSSEAAKLITSLIQSSIDAVDNGSELADNTAKALNEVAENVNIVVSEMEQFATRYQEQAYALQGITSGIDQISIVVQNNSATSEENAATSEELASLVKVMRNLTERFKL
ncbi:MAG: methyl-accepting chemotaxis protein [Ruminococcaceae bacterium]|nr:methyl-accepting chemotaxis protein [Oscillospiraceae bacterium]